MRRKMRKRFITETAIGQYEEFLRDEEKSRATIEKYMRDVRKLVRFVRGRQVTKGLVMMYKKSLMDSRKYKNSSINSYLVAANRFFEYLGWQDVRVKTLKIQDGPFRAAKRSLSKAEYGRLVRAAKAAGKGRLAMMLQTICSTGIRVSELKFVTVEAVREGILQIRCKGKARQALLPTKLREALFGYIEQVGVTSGVVFRTRNGNPVDRSNFWREMKEAGRKAGVDTEKVFPHNLRHLFAQEFYAIKKDIAKLADILGHSSIETTRVYIKTTLQEYQGLLDTMDLIVL